MWSIQRTLKRLLLLMVPVSAFSQIDKGLVTYTLGSDTTAIQYYEFDKRKLKFNTTILSFTGTLTRFDGEGEYDVNGDLRSVRSASYRIDSTRTWNVVGQGNMLFKGDSTVYTLTSNGKEVVRRSIPGKGIVSNGADFTSFLVFPYMPHFAPVQTGDTLFSCQLVFGNCTRYMLYRSSPAQIRVGSTVMGILTLNVDSSNNLRGIDGVGSSLNFRATVEKEDKNYLIYIDQVAKRRFTSGILAYRNFRDTVAYVKGNDSISIDYWRPHRRDRMIFGSVVPWNRFWRLGANNATQLRTNTALEFNRKILPEGRYSLWVLPSPGKWELMINSKPDVWGTNYDPTHDLMVVPLNVTRSDEVVDIMEISLEEMNGKLRLLIEWEYYKAYVDFSPL